MKIFDYCGKKNISGECIRLARKKIGLSQSELAARLQVKGVVLERDTISRIELGDRFLADYELRAMAEVLKVDVLWLLGIKQEDTQ